MAGRPRLLLLDEPMAGLSAGESQSMQAILEQIDRSIAVLLIEHDMDIAFAFAERVTVLHQGRVLTEGSRERGERQPRRAADLPRGRMLTLTDVHTYYGDSHVLQGVTLSVEKGTVTAVLGRNGVGKTTLCRSIVGLTPARAGQIVFNGEDDHGAAAAPHLRARASASCRRGGASSRR